MNYVLFPTPRNDLCFCNLCFYFYLIKNELTFYTNKHKIHTLKHKFAILFFPLPGMLSEIKLTQTHEKNIILTK